MEIEWMSHCLATIYYRGRIWIIDQSVQGFWQLSHHRSREKPIYTEYKNNFNDMIRVLKQI